MEVLAIILLAVWLIGMFVIGVCVSWAVKNDTSEQTRQIQARMDQDPGLMLGLLSLIIFAWPATLVYAAAKRKK